MPTFRITAPDGKTFRVTAPEGATKEDALARVQAQYSTPTLTQTNPGEYDPNSPEFQAKFGPTSGMSNFDKFAAGAGKAVVDLGRGIKQLAVDAKEAVTGPNLSSLVTGETDSSRLRRQQDETNRLDAPLMHTGAGLVGNIAGNVAATVLPGGLASRAAQAGNAMRTANVIRSVTAPSTIAQAATSGAVLGGLQPVGTQDSRAMNAALGGVGGAAGGALASGVGRVIRPIAPADPARQALAGEAAARGIPLTVGDRTGSKPVQVLESVLSNTPGAAGKEAALAQAKQEAYNRAVAELMGERGAASLTPDVLQAARRRIGGEFDRLSAGRTVQLNNQLLNAITDVDNATAPVRGVLDTGRVDQLIENMLNLASKGQVTGEVAQQIRSAITQEANDAARQGNSALAFALKKMRQGVDDSIRGGLSMDEQAAWDIARNQWGNMRTIERAMSTNANATSGNMTGDALLGALKQSGTQLSRQQNDAKTLGQIGRQFVKPQVPDSGTAQRTMIQNMLTSGGAAALGGSALGADPVQAGAAGAALPVAAMLAQPALRSRLIGEYLTRGIAPNASPRLIALGQQLQRLSGPTAAAALLEQR